MGKGSHTTFLRRNENGRVVSSYPIPTKKEVLICYVRGCRRRFGLTEEDGISDEDFYGAK
jgi:hypothetical protein